MLLISVAAFSNCFEKKKNIQFRITLNLPKCGIKTTKFVNVACKLKHTHTRMVCDWIRSRLGNCIHASQPYKNNTKTPKKKPNQFTYLLLACTLKVSSWIKPKCKTQCGEKLVTTTRCIRIQIEQLIYSFLPFDCVWVSLCMQKQTIHASKVAKGKKTKKCATLTDDW